MDADPAIPASSLLFEPVQDAYGTRLALVFGNEAPGGVCPFYGSQCHHCDIGAGEGVQFDPTLNAGRLDFFRHHYAAILPRVAHLVVYNSGSVLNPRELSDASLRTILEFAAELPECRVVSLDSRESFITPARLDILIGCLPSDQQPRAILGLETQDDVARVDVLKKKMSRRNIEAAFRAVGHYGGRIGLDVNIVFAPPPFHNRAAAAAEAEATVSHALELAARHGTPVDFNLHPYYPSRVGRERFPGHPRADLDAALDAALRARSMAEESGLGSKIFIGWQDESHDQEPALRTSELARHRNLFARFNAP
jgi:hypothetical protein